MSSYQGMRIPGVWRYGNKFIACLPDGEGGKKYLSPCLFVTYDEAAEAVIRERRRRKLPFRRRDLAALC